MTKIVPSEGKSEEELLNTAASAEKGSTHPLAEAVREAAGEIELSPEAILTQVPGKGMVLTLGCSVTAVGNTALMKDFGITPEEVPTQGTVMHVIKDGTYMGHIVLEDSLRTDSAKAVKELREQGIKGSTCLRGTGTAQPDLFRTSLGSTATVQADAR